MIATTPVPVSTTFPQATSSRWASGNKLGISFVYDGGIGLVLWLLGTSKWPCFFCYFALWIFYAPILEMIAMHMAFVLFTNTLFCFAFLPHPLWIDPFHRLSHHDNYCWMIGNDIFKFSLRCWTWHLLVSTYEYLILARLSCTIRYLTGAR